ncbi:MAG: hypothetical protein ACE37I_17045 [Rubinisphaera brasiliensis]|uniref:Carbohydrate-binding domain-containing protein n=1 Tax=Rubinisphaera brasiliensis (strain ATCC 49424 / DSM 5305 / JCM 21570 / IAM 15109 / NBRC 103401 / IFAM 1448) TaxID=756272 RepID=F0SHB0_RUBBR|nr:hypothetical protein [Rubinisphaera brasiliensis]ADY61665.1 hypothetical protein Plabr_4088 [Rubinisphaera brasiliensis DSM 5305]
MSHAAQDLLIPPEFYFQPRYEIAFHRTAAENIAAGKHPSGLTRLPDLNFGGQEDRKTPVVSVGWNDSGLAIDVEFPGKPHPWPAGYSRGAELGDFHSFYLDTRDLKTNRRATRFCHLFQVLANDQEPPRAVVKPAPMPHSRQESLVKPESIPTAWTSQKNGYRVSFWLYRELLTGFDPENVPSLGFYYHIHDEAAGDFYFGLGEEFPCDTDPSLWPSLQLKR